MARPHRPDDLRVNYDGSDLAKAAAELEARGRNIAELTTVIAEDLAERVIERFELQSGHKQGGWPELAASTVASRRASESISMLRDTGIMYGSITPHGDAEGAEAFTNTPYAKYHVSPKPRRVIPLRDFFDIDFEAATQYAADLLLTELI